MYANEGTRAELQVQLVETFCRELSVLGGEAHVAKDQRQAAQLVASILRQWAAESCVAQGGLAESFPDVQAMLQSGSVALRQWGTNVLTPQDMADAQAGLVVADWAIAATGSLLLVAAPNKGRSVSLLPPAIIVLVPASRLTSTRGEAFKALALQRNMGNTGWPSNMTLVTGPSRTADIESDLSIGVHGPGKVAAVVVLHS